MRKKMTSAKVREKVEKEFEKWVRRNYKESNGYYVLHKGFPDRVIYNVQTKELLFFELKGHKKGNKPHKFHYSQKQMCKVLTEGKKRTARVFVGVVDKRGKCEIEKNVDYRNKGIRVGDWEGERDLGLIGYKSKVSTALFHKDQRVRYIKSKSRGTVVMKSKTQVLVKYDDEEKCWEPPERLKTIK